jgi:U3 small nucleolar RNA-associated protein 14
VFILTNNLAPKEYKKRHGELAKMRALMFYEEQKRHRINKIKSKKYRKIQKRKREREKDAEDEGARLDGKFMLVFVLEDLII